MSVRVAAILIAGAMAVSGSGFARDSVAVAKEVSSEVAAELAECAAYYAVAAAATEASFAPSPERDEIVTGAKKAEEAAIVASAQLTSQKIAAARVSLSVQTLTHQMEGSWENFSIVAAKYAWPCKDRVEALDKRFAYWLKEKEKLPDVPPAVTRTAGPRDARCTSLASTHRRELSALQFFRNLGVRGVAGSCAKPPSQHRVSHVFRTAVTRASLTESCIALPPFAKH